MGIGQRACTGNHVAVADTPGNFGIISCVTGSLGLGRPFWISTPGYAVVAVSIVGLWSSPGFSMIILGAGLTPSIFFVVIVTTISSFQLFDLLYAILGAKNPATSASIAIVVFTLIGLVTLVQFRLQKRWVVHG